MKNVSSFCSAKATHIFSAKNLRILYIESAKTVNEMTLNELIKLTTLWTTGPCAFIKTRSEYADQIPHFATSNLRLRWFTWFSMVPYRLCGEIDLLSLNCFFHDFIMSVPFLFNANSENAG